MMRTGSLLRKWAVALMTVVLMISLLVVPAFAEEATTNAAGSAATNANAGLTNVQLVSLIIAGVLIVAAVVLGIIFREKVKKFLRVYKSESKKIVWLSWEQTRKSTWVVLVVLILSALSICLIDFGLQRGYLAFIDFITGKSL